MQILIRILQNEKNISVFLEWQSIHIANLWAPRSLNNPEHILKVTFVNDFDAGISQDNISHLSIVVWF